MKKILLIVFIAIFSINSYAQKQSVKKSARGLVRCYSTEYEKSLQNKNRFRADKASFETWIAKKITDQKKSNSRVSAVSGPTVIPVVVHVISNGEAIGTSENISDAQVISQIISLNNDYRKKVGTMGYNNNPVGADANIEFVLAVKDPNGNPTNGIDRKTYSNTYWDEAGVENTLKPATIWDPTKYLNIWVVNFGGDLDGVLGYAQFPEFSTLTGIDYPPFTAQTDGVIIGYQYFGNLDYDNNGSFNLDSTYGYGRTTTHEVGHWLGLRHIWGDESCGTDYVADTPVHEADNYGCFSHPKANSCGTADEMFENYMDYTDDLCMNIFTINQVDRFNAVILNSPRRKELPSSTGLASSYSYDAMVFAEPDFTEVLATNCSSSRKANVRIFNRGTSVITSANLSINDGGTIYTKTWTGSLSPNRDTLVNLDLLGTKPNNSLSVSVTTINGSGDQNSSNNVSTYNYTYGATQSFNTTTVKLALQLDEYGSETTWELLDSKGSVLYESETYADTEGSTPALKNYTFNLSNNECYTFNIYDDYGDGFCCDYGNGYYKLTTGDNTVMVNKIDFMSSADSYNFILGNLLATTNVKKLETTIFPNPANDVLNITKVSSKSSYKIYSVDGKLINSGNVKENKVNVSKLSKGVYLITIEEDGKSYQTKFIKN